MAELKIQMVRSKVPGTRERNRDHVDTLVLQALRDDVTVRRIVVYWDDEVIGTMEVQRTGSPAGSVTDGGA